MHSQHAAFYQDSSLKGLFDLRYHIKYHCFVSIIPYFQPSPTYEDYIQFFHGIDYEHCITKSRIL